ncbi:MAG: DUF5067 domain-containing protein [Clostridia bacterium]|nr:DUF5067 domain-containing protein [Clostridia bacterium]
MKKLLALLLCGVMLFAFAACGDKPETPETPDDPAVETNEPEAPKGFEVTTGTSGDFDISILGAETVDCLGDVKGIRIYYQITNNASYNVKAVDDLKFSATQNDESLDGGIARGADVAEDTADERYIRPGVTLRAASVRELNDETTAVKFSVGDYSSEDKVEVEFDLANLPGAPTDTLEIVPVTEGFQVEGLATEGTLDGKYDVKITGVEKTTNKSGKDVIVVHYSFTNNSDKAVRFNSAVRAKAFQDGYQLKDTTPQDLQDVAYKNKTTDCEVGQTLNVDCYYELISTSPCEVEVADGHMSMSTDEYFEERLGLVFTVA